MPCLWPSPERGRTSAASPGSSMWMASPVGSNWVCPGASVTGASMQARRSMPAEPSVAYAGSGNCVPTRASRMRTFNGCRRVNVSMESSLRGVRRQGGGAQGLGAALGDDRRDELDEFARQLRLGVARQELAAIAPQHDEFVIGAVERLVMTDFIRRDHIEVLAQH